MSHCRSRSQLCAAVFNVTKSPLELCSGHSLAMCCAVWSVAPPSYYADGESPIWFMLYINLPYPVLIRFRRTSECHATSCPTGFFDRVWMNSLNSLETIEELRIRRWSVNVFNVIR